jgi:DNA modification methylase
VSVYYSDDAVTLHHGHALDVLKSLPDGSVNCVCTSPPYFGLRDYGEPGQYGLESSPAEYVENMRVLFAEVRRVLADDGTLWLNLGDSYSTGGALKTANTNAGFNERWGNSAGARKQESGRPSARRDNADVAGPRVRFEDRPAKNLLGIPWRTAFALQDDSWILRNAIVWSKPNAMPESVTDRLSTRHELLFLFSKSRRYWFDLDFDTRAVVVPDKKPYKRHQNGGGSKESMESDFRSADGSLGYMKSNDAGRNPGDVWTIPTQPFPGAHFAVFPVEIPRRCIAAGCKPGGTVLDPFSGSGTTGLAAGQLGRKYVGADLSRKYLDLSLETRLAQTALLDGGAA